jgi:FixJ family two-component response regulator
MISTKLTPIIHIVAERAEVRCALAGRVEGMQWLVLTYAGLVDYVGNYAANSPGCVIVDVPLSGTGRFELQKLWRSESMLPVIVISATGDIETAVQVMKDGAFDCLESPVPDHELLGRVAAALRQDAANRQDIERNADLKCRVESLTRREREVLALLTVGTLNKVIASKLGLSRRTVEVHRTSVMKKMHAVSVAHLINMCLALDSAHRRRLPVNRRSYSWRTDAVV